MRRGWGWGEKGVRPAASPAKPPLSRSRSALGFPKAQPCIDSPACLARFSLPILLQGRVLTRDHRTSVGGKNSSEPSLIASASPTFTAERQTLSFRWVPQPDGPPSYIR